MKIADYVSKYLKESYDESLDVLSAPSDNSEQDVILLDFERDGILDLPIEILMDLKKDITLNTTEGKPVKISPEDAKELLDNHSENMEDGKEDKDAGTMTDKEIDDLFNFDEGKGSGDCPECETTEEGEDCPECGTKKEGTKEEGYKEEGYKKDPFGNIIDKLSVRSYRDPKDKYDEKLPGDDDYDDYDREIKFDKYGNKIGGDPLAGLKRKPRGLYSSKNYKMTEMEKKLEDYREGKKNKKGHKPKGVVDADDSSDGE